MAKEALDELEEALAKVATPSTLPTKRRSRTWTLNESDTAAEIRAELQSEPVWAEAEPGGVQKHIKALGWMAGVATTQLAPTTGVIKAP